MAEWSKALVLGTSPKGRGFESHRCQIFYQIYQNEVGDTGDRTRNISLPKQGAISYLIIINLKNTSIRNSNLVIDNNIIIVKNNYH